MFFNSDDAEDDSAAEEKTYANYQDYKNSQGKTTKKEEHYLHKHQRQVETDIKRLESKKRTLSLALQNSCNDLRRAFEEQWRVMVEDFERGKK